MQSCKACAFVLCIRRTTLHSCNVLSIMLPLLHSHRRINFNALNKIATTTNNNEYGAPWGIWYHEVAVFKLNTSALWLCTFRCPRNIRSQKEFRVIFIFLETYFLPNYKHLSIFVKRKCEYCIYIYSVCSFSENLLSVLKPVGTVYQLYQSEWPWWSKCRRGYVDALEMDSRRTVLTNIYRLGKVCDTTVTCCTRTDSARRRFSSQQSFCPVSYTLYRRSNCPWDRSGSVQVWLFVWTLTFRPRRVS